MNAIPGYSQKAILASCVKAIGVQCRKFEGNLAEASASRSCGGGSGGLLFIYLFIYLFLNLAELGVLVYWGSSVSPTGSCVLQAPRGPHIQHGYISHMQLRRTDTQ